MLTLYCKLTHYCLLRYIHKEKISTDKAKHLWLIALGLGALALSGIWAMVSVENIITIMHLVKLHIFYYLITYFTHLYWFAFSKIIDTIDFTFISQAQTAPLQGTPVAIDFTMLPEFYYPVDNDTVQYPTCAVGKALGRC
jgi:hypothetical protein